MKRVLEQELLTMEIIVNPKTLPNGTNVIQLETAVGAAMKCFNGATGERRTRRQDDPGAGQRGALGPIDRAVCVCDDTAATLAAGLS